MAYGYTPYYQPYMQAPQPAQNQYMQGNQNNMTWVQGEAGAKSYLVAPNTTVPLWDSEKQTIYIKSADASGMPSMKILDYSVRDAETGQKQPFEHKTDNYATKDDMAALKAEIMQEINALRGETDA
jgi:hypothetical protein